MCSPKIHIKCDIVTVSELKSTEFREGRKSYKGIRGVAGLTRKSIRKIPGDYGRAIRGNLSDAGEWRRQ